MSFGAYVWAGVAALSAYRALVRPVRAVFASGTITECPGAHSCEPTLDIRSATGMAFVHSLVSGVVNRVIPGKLIELVSNNEAVVVSYAGSLVLNEAGARIAPGQRVKVGQILGQATQVGLSVSRITRLADGSLALAPLEPASWLAARGLRAATRLSDGTKWCQGGRSLVIPSAVARCNIGLPTPSGFSLLPVNASFY